MYIRVFEYFNCIDNILVFLHPIFDISRIDQHVGLKYLYNVHDVCMI